jgi:hypothetical protein
MRRSCSRFAFADLAFYGFRKGGKNVTGGSIHLARELARVWGNVQYGLTELRRDDIAAQSEMLAFAWDVQTNTRTSTTFVVPHERDVDGSRAPLTSLRDIYDNNANHGARRVRSMVFAILPPWFTDEAQEICRATMKAGDGTPLQSRVGVALERLAALGVTRERAESRMGYPSSVWTPDDLVTLGVLFRSIERGETTTAEEFPAGRLTMADIVTVAPASTPPPAPVQQDPERTITLPASAGDVALVRAALTERGIGGRSNRDKALTRWLLAAITGQSSLDQLTTEQAGLVLHSLTGDAGARWVEAAAAEVDGGQVAAAGQVPQVDPDDDYAAAIAAQDAGEVR